MYSVFLAEGYLNLTVVFVLLALSIFAFVNSLLYSAEAYRAADKLSKPAWCAILGFGVLIRVYPVALPFGTIVGVALLVAMLVYLVDVRPALAGLFRR